MFHNKILVEVKCDEVVIHDIFVTNENYITLIILIKDIKKTKVRIKKHGILVDFHTVGTINTDGNKMVQLKNYF